MNLPLELQSVVVRPLKIGDRDKNIGVGFRRIDVAGLYGWVEVEEGAYCFDPKETLSVHYRNAEGVDCRVFRKGDKYA